MTRKIRTLCLVATLPLGLAACGGGGGGDTTPVTPPPPVATTAFQDKFGTTFSTTFNASTTADPRDPTSADLPALNATADPLDN